MSVFRSYGVTLTNGDQTKDWWFEERAGALLSAAGAPPSEKIGEWPLNLAPIGSTVKLSVYGDKTARRAVPAQDDPARRLIRLFDAVAHFRAGAVLRGLERYSFLKYAAELEAEVLAEAMTEDLRMNLVTEACYGAWRPLDLVCRPLLAALAGVDASIPEGELAKVVRNWYAKADSWTTRLAGFKFNAEHFLRYENGVEKSKVASGDTCMLVREHHNPDDPNAVAVLHSTGEKLGYLRRTIAQHVAPALDAGSMFAARVCVFLPQETPLDERIYLRMDRVA